MDVEPAITLRARVSASPAIATPSERDHERAELRRRGRRTQPHRPAATAHADVVWELGVALVEPRQGCNKSQVLTRRWRMTRPAL